MYKQKLPKKTSSLCPVCAKKIPAKVFEKGGKVWIEKECKEHGKFKEVYFEDFEMYEKFRKFGYNGRGVSNPNTKSTGNCPFDCGLCSNHKSHTCLANIAVTNRCDLRCWYCLPYDEEIIIKNKNKIELKKIGELIENYPNKWKKIKKGYCSIPKNLWVLSFDNNKLKWKKITKFFRRKYIGNFIRIETSSGKKIITTEDHHIFRKKGEKIIKKEAKELSKGEVVLSLRNFESKNESKEIDLFEEFKNLPEKERKKVYVRGIKDYLYKVAKNKTFKKVFQEVGIESDAIYSQRINDSIPLSVLYKLDKKNPLKVPNNILFGVDAAKYNIKRKIKITPKLTKLIGYFIADGHYTDKNLVITCKNDSYTTKEVETCLKNLKINYSIQKVKNKTPQIFIGNKIFYLLFKYVFCIPGGAGNKRLPKQALSFPHNCKISLLEGLINGDGAVCKGSRHISVELASVSRNLIKDVIYLLSSLGIFARIHKTSMKKNPLSNYDYIYKAYIASQELLKLRELVKLKPTHSKKLKNIQNRKDITLKRIGDFVEDPIKKITVIKNKKTNFVYDIEVNSKSHSFIGGEGILISNCFYFAKEGGNVYEPSLKQIREMLRVGREEKPVPPTAIQLTGGNPELRPDLIEIIKICKEEGYDHVQLNTQGTYRLYKDLKFAKEVKKAGVNTIYLSFDGVSKKTNPKNHWEVPYIFNNLRKANLGCVLVPTVIRGINDLELGSIVNFALNNLDIVRGVNFQPVSLVGRMPRDEREKQRITIPGVIKNLEEQTKGIISKEDFYPVPVVRPITRFVEAITGRPQYSLSCHFACGAATYLFLDGDKVIPITRFVDVEGFLEYLDKKAEEIENKKNKYIVALKILFNLKKFIDKKKEPKNLNFYKLLFNALVKHNYKSLGEIHHRSLFIGMMHFQDLYNYDVERVERCVIHYLMPNKKIIPFCTFNVLPEFYRDKVQEEFSIKTEEWEKKNKRKLKDDIYHRDIKKLESGKIYKKTYFNLKNFFA